MSINKTKTVTAVVCSFFLFLTCARQDTLYNASSQGNYKLDVFAADTTGIASTISKDSIQSILKAQLSTIPGEPITLFGFITGDTSKVTPKWNFGDGKDTTGTILVHTYDTTGTFHAVFSITDKEGFSISDTVAITVIKVNGSAVRGNVEYQGKSSHKGIYVVLVDKVHKGNSAIDFTKSSGSFRLDSLVINSTYDIVFYDSTYHNAFSPCTLHDISIKDGVQNVLPAVTLQDNHPPHILNNKPSGVLKIRQPAISANFTDTGSGISPHTFIFTINRRIIPDSIMKIDTAGFSYMPAQRLPDGVYALVASIQDSAGNNDTISWSFKVDAMKLTILTLDTTVRINDTLRLRSLVSNVYSKVALYKWDFDGNGIWDDSLATADTLISRPHVYTHDSIYKAILYCCDDSGTVKLDTVTINVGNLPPVISSIREDTTISIKDSIQLFGAAHDVDGTIKEYAWDFTNDGTFEYISATQINTGYRYNKIGTYIAVLRVTDDDNKTAYDSTRIIVVQDTPQIIFFSSDTVVNHGGSVRCSVYVSQQFGTMTVEIDTANSGVFKSLGGLGLSGGKSYTFPTGNACSWDSVKMRITDDDENVVTRGFKVDIWPQPLTITSIDSTANTITVHYSQTQETDFSQYLIYRNTTSMVDINNELWATISASGTVSYTTPPSYAWEPRYYRVYQKDNEGLMSVGSNVVYGNIVNSPPTTPIITYPSNNGDSIWPNEVLRWKCSDANNQVVKYKILSNYNNSGYIQFGAEILDTFVRLRGYDSLSIAFKVIAYDSEGDSSGWSAERTAVIHRNIVYDVEGNMYKVVNIGNQIWMAENLLTTQYNDGTAIPLETGYCWYNNDSATYAHPYGALYNWYTVNTGKLAPIGWRVPTDSEWSVLTTYLGGENVAGGKLKETGTTHWQSPNTGATNETDFSALPGGSRDNNGTFMNFGGAGQWWSSTATDATHSMSRIMDYMNRTVVSANYYNNFGLSVRCVRDR